MLEALLQLVLKPMPKPIKNLFYKYESVWRYCYYGAWTTLISIIAKIVGKWLIESLGYDITSTVPNILNTSFSWIIAVTFAFVVNKKYVFKSKTKSTQDLLFEMGTFYGARGVTYFLEVAIMWLFTSHWKFNYYVITVLSQFIVLAINYVFSKLVVFKKGSESTVTASKS